MKRKNKNTKAEKKFKEKIKKKLTSQEKDIKDIWRRIRKRDFSGNTGLAIKNSLYQTLTNVVAKGGSLIFTIIIARLLLPELFGLYSLALSTILLFTSISDLGIGGPLIRFVSKELRKRNKRKAKAYTIYLGKIKLILISLSVFLLLISAKFISHNFYQKPIFLALLAGTLYIIFIQAVSFLQSILQASNYFKGVFHKEILFQISRIILVPLAVLFALKYSLSYEYTLFYIILFLSISYLLTSLFIWYSPIKKINFIKTKELKLTSKQNKIINRFLMITSATIFSGLFFSYIDKIMLGYFVRAEFIGYYTASFSLVGALASFVGFGAVLLPIFSRLGKTELQKGLKKSRRIVSILSIPLVFITILLAPLAISIIYGIEYSSSISILRVLSLLLIVFPLIGIYSSYFMSIGKPQVLAKLLILSTILNIVLNYVFITSFLPYGHLAAVYGAATGTIISQGFYLGGLVWRKRKNL